MVPVDVPSIMIAAPISGSPLALSTIRPVSVAAVSHCDTNVRIISVQNVFISSFVQFLFTLAKVR